jgi:3-oxosteroid 1-dehydrogenase
LAALVGIDPAGLATTVERWNAAVDAGADAEFGRGTLTFEAHMTGHVPSPAHCLARISEPPFYAIELRPGTIGTSGGPRIDQFARVVAGRGGVIAGLYAAGNVAAAVFGPAYPGGGATLGPAMTFGYLAGRHVATQERRNIDSAPRDALSG